MKNHNFSFLIFILLLTLLIRLLRIPSWLGTIQSLLFATSILTYFLGVITLITPLILFRSEINELDKFHIDKYSIIAFGCCLVVNLIYSRQDILLFVVLGISVLYFIKLQLFKNNKIIKTDIFWSIKSVLLGLVFSIIIVAFQFLVRESWSIAPLLRNSILATVIRQIIIEISFVPIEEILYRGFLWGYLKSKGWDEKIVFMVQGGLFWITHVEKLTTPLSFFLFIPLLTLLLSYLRRKSNQIFPSIVAHITVNSISVLLSLASI